MRIRRRNVIPKPKPVVTPVEEEPVDKRMRWPNYVVNVYNLISAAPTEVGAVSTHLDRLAQSMANVYGQPLRALLIEHIGIINSKMSGIIGDNKDDFVKFFVGLDDGKSANLWHEQISPMMNAISAIADARLNRNYRLALEKLQDAIIFANKFEDFIYKRIGKL